MFYIAGNGKNSQTFIASAKISSIEILNEAVVVDPDKKSQMVMRYLIFDNILFFKKT